MADTNETISDIIAEKRRLAEQIRNNLSTVLVRQWHQQAEIKSLEDEANRLEAAHRRERGDAAKLREALKAIGGLCAGLMPTWDGAVGRIKDVAEAALSAPPRNCDVGTVEEQFARFMKFCKKGSMDNFEATAYCAYECPCGDNYDCKLAWAQMPYEEGGAK